MPLFQGLNFSLYDRIKETSYTTGTQNFVLNGAVGGFSSFGSVYPNNGVLFYAATDGTDYEVGSGVYVSGVQNILRRHPFRSSNNNQKVSFNEGIKEVFVTYPATHAVHHASGLENTTSPKAGSIAFWSSSNIINYDQYFTWDSGLNRLGINNLTPSYAIDIGGQAASSIIRSSGMMVGSSGLMFPYANNGDSSYQGGTQLTHYEANELEASTSIDQIIEISGNAKNHFLLRQQDAGLVFAGPVSGCTPPCSPDYPNFRPLFLCDIGELDGLTSESVENATTEFPFLYEVGFKSAKRFGIGSAPRNSSQFLVVRENTPGSGGFAIHSISRTNSTSSNIQTSDTCLVASSRHTVNSGVDAINGSMIAGKFISLRNPVLLPGDGGTLSNMYGVVVEYGNTSGNFPNQSPVTRNAYGLYISPFNGSGTLQNAYDIYLGSPVINSGVIQKHYGIYQNGDRANYLNGSLGVNTLPSGGKVCSFNNSFDPASSGTWLKAAYVASGLYGGGISLLDTINPNASGQFGYSIYTTEQGINLNIDMGNKLGEGDPVLKLYAPNQNSINQATMIFFGDKLNIRNPKTPAAPTASGIRGDICWDNNYLYVCVANNTWKRTYISTW